MKVIFLDIDGVLNTEVFIRAFWSICKEMELSRVDANLLKRATLRDEYGIKFDPMAVDFLKHIVDETNAKIVISSTWRLSGLPVMQAMWEQRNLPGEVIDVTGKHDERIRGEEIKTWLESNPVDAYVIIDDDRDMLEEQQSKFVRVHSQYGITYQDARKAVMVLNH